MLVACTTKCSITKAQRANLVRARVGSLAPSTFLTETKLYTTTESPSGEPFAIDQRWFRDCFRVDNLTFERSRWANWNPAFGREKQASNPSGRWIKTSFRSMFRSLPQSRTPGCTVLLIKWKFPQNSATYSWQNRKWRNSCSARRFLTIPCKIDKIYCSENLYYFFFRKWNSVLSERINVDRFCWQSFSVFL